MRIAATLLISTILLAGCLADTATDADVEPRPRKPVARSAPESGSTPHVDESSFSWNATQLSGDIVLMFEVRTEAYCDTFVDVSMAPKAYGPTRWIINENRAGWTAAGGSQSAPAYVHAQDIDTREEGESSHGAGRTRIGGTGDRNITIAVRGVTPYEGGNFLAPGHRLGFEVRCEGPVTVTNFREAREFSLFSPSNMEDGYGISAGVVSVSLDDHMRRKIQSSRGDVFLMSSAGIQAGEAQVVHPEGSEQCPIDPNSLFWCRAQSGPGDYDVALDRIADSAPFFGLIVGTERVETLDLVDRPSDISS